MRTFLNISLTIVSIIVALFSAPDAWGLEADTLRATQYYGCSSARIGAASDELRRIILQLDSLQRLNRTDSLLILGNSSPDGPWALNDSLAKRRALGMKDYVVSGTSIPEDIIDLASNVSSWQDVSSIIDNTPALSSSANAIEAKRLIGVHHNNPSYSLRRAYGGRIWRWLATDVFPLMRKSVVTVFYDGKSQQISGDTLKQGVYLEDITDPVIVEDVAVAQENPTPEWMRHIYLKTNLPAWLCLWTNAAFEVDIAPHFSFTLPVYYSGFNYFKQNLKFRTFALQPEFRWFPKTDNSGFFAGIHAGIAYYNIALKGDLRYQDHNGTHPAWGGGIALGYRFRLNSNPNLYMEASLGGGIYKLYYDKFLNIHNGLKVGQRKRTFYGVDQAALSFVYRFDCGRRSKVKKGGNL